MSQGMQTEIFASNLPIGMMMPSEGFLTRCAYGTRGCRSWEVCKLNLFCSEVWCTYYHLYGSAGSTSCVAAGWKGDSGTLGWGIGMRFLLIFIHGAL